LRHSQISLGVLESSDVSRAPMERGTGCPLNMAKKDHEAIGAFKNIIVQV